MNNTTTHVGRRTLSGLTALGSSQATAFPLLNLANHEFTTVASSTGAVLPTAKLADSVTVWNGGSNTLFVYPPLGGTVNGGSTNAAYSLTTATGLTFFASDLLTWYADSAPASSGSGTVNSGTSGQVAYYGTTGAAVSGEGLSALIDAVIGSTQGDILYRGASAWSVLAPGSSGKLLQSGGPAANPSWVTASGTGTVTTISVVSANGFTGTVANATTTPAITLTTSATGILTGNGTTISAAADIGVGANNQLNLAEISAGHAGQRRCLDRCNPAFSRGF